MASTVHDATGLVMVYPASDRYRVCTRCVMDTSDRDISFDEDGVCVYCRRYDKEIRPLLPVADEGHLRFDEAVCRIRRSAREGEYDCVLGLSGGLDSSYLAYLAWKAGLRVLVIHLDNSWNSELAVGNVENIVRKTGFDYVNHVVDWDEFRDIQLAYLKASVLDIEVVSDHAIFALMYREAMKHGVKTILSGENYALEGGLSGRGWNYRNKQDVVNLRAIHAAHGTVKLRTYPTFSLHEVAFAETVRGIHRVRLLDCVDYRKEDARRLLEREFGWRYYGGKHYESLFTKFYQAYILPVKFGLDKRRIHLSSLINSGQMAREEAIAELAKPLYPVDELRRDYEYVIKKLGLTDEEFQAMMSVPSVPHEAFATERVSRIDRLRYAAFDFILGSMRGIGEWKWSYYRLRTAIRVFNAEAHAQLAGGSTSEALATGGGHAEHGGLAGLARKCRDGVRWRINRWRERMRGAKADVYRPNLYFNNDAPPQEQNTREINDMFYGDASALEQYFDGNRLSFYSDVVDMLSSLNAELDGLEMLDVGCGTGHMLDYVRRRFAPAVTRGCDFSQAAIAYAEKAFPHSRFFVQDIYEKIPGAYDVVLCCEVLEHILYADKAIRNIVAVLRPGGHGFVTSPDGRKDTLIQHINFWSPESWDAMWRGVGGVKIMETGKMPGRDINYAWFQKTV